MGRWLWQHSPTLGVCAAALGVALLASVACIAAEMRPPKAIDDLRSLPQAKLVGWLEQADTPDYAARLMQYRSSGLTQHALVAIPHGTSPAGGYPVILANHGTHPNPRQYGISADGVDSRPGDYYRNVPAAYTQNGFLVIMPDYRGHNVSEGAEYARGLLATHYYTEDALGALSLVDEVPDANERNVFLWGHSLGGEVALRSLLAANGIRAASLWSTVGGSLWDQAYYYARYREPLADDRLDLAKGAVDSLRSDLERFGSGFDWRSGEPLRHLDRLATPVIVHHAIEDRGAAYDWSRSLAAELARLRKPYHFHSYAGDDHMFAGSQFDVAVSRDVAFFARHMVR